ncbi:hypothetical protein GCM10010302_17070 [Streptomyces polychromogenes]|uniref:Uncharacterized protein n=1 Tax=Streptomyces polychromogenes TaxID=67342 RepID=A0ABN0V7W8_9ACTN
MASHALIEVSKPREAPSLRAPSPGASIVTPMASGLPSRGRYRSPVVLDNSGQPSPLAGRRRALGKPGVDDLAFGLLLVIAAAVGGNLASTVNITVGVLFLASGFVHLFLISGMKPTSWTSVCRTSSSAS